MLMKPFRHHLTKNLNHHLLFLSEWEEMVFWEIPKFFGFPKIKLLIKVKET